MKTNNWWNRMTLLFGFVAMFLIAGCSSEENKDDNGDENRPSLGMKLVDKVYCEWRTIQFSYDSAGNITKIEYEDRDGYKQVELKEKYSFSRIEDKLNVTGYCEEFNEKKTLTATNTYLCTLNREGYIASVENSMGDNFQCSYQNGQLHTFTGTSDGDNVNMNFSWKDNCLAGISGSDKYGPFNADYIYYTQKENKANIDFAELCYAYDIFPSSISGSINIDYYGAGDFLPLSFGYLGKRNAFLLQKKETQSYINKFTYHYDKEGYVDQFFHEYTEGSLEHYTDTYTVTYTE